MIPISPAKGYTEFLSDSIERIYEYKTSEYQYVKYWVDSLLYIGQTRDDGMQIITDEYNFHFSGNNNILRLDSKSYFATFHTSIYKRIN